MHIEKYKSDAVVGIMKHYTREHITENVEIDRTSGNIYCYNESFKIPEKYKSASIKKQIMETIDKRTARKVKAKQNVILDLVITQPEEMGTELNKKFFDDMIYALQNKYNYNGFNPFKKENMVMYAIHQDEKGQPHLHYSFMPITPNHTRRIRHEQGKAFRNIDLEHERLNSDSFMKLDFLKSFHSTMETLTGYTLTKSDNEKRDLTMKEYQNKQEIDKLKERIKEQDKEKETLKELKNENNNLEKEIENKKIEIKEYDKKINDKKIEFNILDNKIENKKIEIKDIEKKIELKNNDFQNIEEKYNKKSEELEKNLDNDRSRLAHLNVELVDTYSKKKEIEKEIAVYEDSLNTFKLKKLFLDQPIVQKMFNEFKSAVKKVNEKER